MLSSLAIPPYSPILDLIHNLQLFQYLLDDLSETLSKD